jgi:hypothetical protein
MENNLPVYIAIVNLEDNNTGMQLVSFVDEPAIEEGFLSFEDQKEMITLAVENEEKRMCYGPIMLANKKIYRRTEQGFEYMIVFTPENIELMLQKFMSQNNGNNVDENHSFKLIDGVTLCQVFIKNSDRGINPTDFPDAEEGSLFGIYHVDDDQLWEDIKSGEVKGFSLAGVFDLEKAEAEQFSKINKSNNTNKIMSKLEKVKAMLKAMLQEFGDVSTDRGTLVFDGDELEIGLAVKLLDSEGNEIQAEDGEYITDDKKKVVIADGKVESIDDVEEPEEDPAPAEEELSKKKQAFVAMAEATNETYDEKYRKIYSAIYEKGYQYAYVVEASDDYAIISSWGEDELEHYYKFDLTWDEEGNVSASDPVEVKRTYVPIDEEPEQEPEEEPSTEPETEDKPEEEQMAANNKPEVLSAQEEFAKLDEQPTKKNSKVSAKMEAMAKRGYKFNL